MGRKRVIIGQSEWGIDDKSVDETISNIKSALESGKVAEVQLLNAADRPVTVYINTKAVETIVIDLDSDPKPSEISLGTGGS